MELKTVIRIYGVISVDMLAMSQDITRDAAVLVNNGDAEVNAALAEGFDIVEINLVYDPDHQMLFDTVYLCRGADDDDRDEELDDMPDDPIEKLMSFDNVMPVIDVPLKARKLSKNDRN